MAIRGEWRNSGIAVHMGYLGKGYGWIQDWLTKKYLSHHRISVVPY